jgi:hypothetical protein
VHRVPDVLKRQALNDAECERVGTPRRQCVHRRGGQGQSLLAIGDDLRGGRELLCANSEPLGEVCAALARPTVIGHDV